MRIVAFHLNLSGFQRKGMRSRRMRFPGLGALGCMSAEGFSFRELKQAPHVTSAVPAREMPKTAIAKDPAEPEREGGKLVQRAVRAPENGGKKGEPAQNSRNAADERGEAAVDQIFTDDLALSVPQRLEGADLHTVLFHHARHGSERHERRDENEEHGKHARDLLYLFAVERKADIADVRARAVENVPFRVRKADFLPHHGRHIPQGIHLFLHRLALQCAQGFDGRALVQHIVFVPVVKVAVLLRTLDLDPAIGIGDLQFSATHRLEQRKDRPGLLQIVHIFRIAVQNAPRNARSQRGDLPSVDIIIIGRGNDPHDRERRLRVHVAVGGIFRIDRNFRADGDLFKLVCGTNDDNFVFPLFGHPPLHDCERVEVLRREVQTVQTDDKFLASHRRFKIGGENGSDRFHAIERGNFIRVLLRQPERPLDGNVGRVVFDQIGTHRVLHVRRRLDHADQKPHADGNDDHDGSKPAEPRLEFLDNVFAEFSHACTSRGRLTTR